MYCVSDFIVSYHYATLPLCLFVITTVIINHSYKIQLLMTVTQRSNEMEHTNNKQHTTRNSSPIN
jgi:hypothetical protein